MYFLEWARVCGNNVARTSIVIQLSLSVVNAHVIGIHTGTDPGVFIVRAYSND